MHPSEHILIDVSYDYTKGKLNELVDIIIDSGAKLFGEDRSWLHSETVVFDHWLIHPTVSAVGVPPRAVVDRLHKHGILYMVSAIDAPPFDS